MIAGQCACGALRYTSSQPPILELHCQCGVCRRLSGTDHGSFMIFERDTVAIGGESSHWSYEAESGGLTTRNFCGECGTHLFGGTSRHPEVIVISASSTEDVHFKPMLRIFAHGAPHWPLDDPMLRVMPRGPS